MHQVDATTTGELVLAVVAVEPVIADSSGDHVATAAAPQGGVSGEIAGVENVVAWACQDVDRLDFGHRTGRRWSGKGGVGDDEVAVTGDLDAVGAGSTLERVESRARFESVVTVASQQQVVEGRTSQEVISAAATQCDWSREPGRVDHVGVSAAGQPGGFE